MSKRWQPGDGLKPFVKALGDDPQAVRKLVEELERHAKESDTPREVLAERKQQLNDWLVDGLESAHRAGVRDWDSPAALRSFGFDAPDDGAEE